MTTIDYYLKSIWQKLPFVLLISLLATLMAYGVTARIGPMYEGHFSYLISMSEREPALAFRFDGYYAISATDLFAATLAAWAQTPEVIIQAYQQAGLSLTNEPSPRQLAKIIQAQKTAPQLVQVTVRTDQEDTTKKLTAGLQAVIAQQLERYHKQGIPAVAFKVFASDSWIGVERPAAPVIVIATFVLIFLLGVNTVIIWASWRRQ